MERCKFCNAVDIQIISGDGLDGEHWKCKRCGEVLISSSAVANLSKYSADFLWFLSAFCRKRTTMELLPILLHTGNLEYIVKGLKKPNGVLEAQNRMIEFIGDKSDLLGSWVAFDQNTDLDLILKFNEIDYIIESLDKRGLIDNPRKQSIQTGGKPYLRLTPEGWNRYEENRRKQIYSQQAFIAMDFNPSLFEVYEQAISPAIEETGYKPYRIDQDRHVDNINNRIIAKIKESRFLIAEFTGHNHGVYFEAGFALGIGIPVIWICQKSDFGKTHFDTKPFNHIIWETKEQLKEDLVWTIKANIT